MVEPLAVEVHSPKGGLYVFTDEKPIQYKAYLNAYRCGEKVQTEDGFNVVKVTLFLRFNNDLSIKRWICENDTNPKVDLVVPFHVDKVVDGDQIFFTPQQKCTTVMVNFYLPGEKASGRSFGYAYRIDCSSDSGKGVSLLFYIFRNTNFGKFRRRAKEEGRAFYNCENRNDSYVFELPPELLAICPDGMNLSVKYDLAATESLDRAFKVPDGLPASSAIQVASSAQTTPERGGQSQQRSLDNRVSNLEKRFDTFDRSLQEQRAQLKKQQAQLEEINYNISRIVPFLDYLDVSTVDSLMQDAQVPNSNGVFNNIPYNQNNIANNLGQTNQNNNFLGVTALNNSGSGGFIQTPPNASPPSPYHYTTSPIPSSDAYQQYSPSGSMQFSVPYIPGTAMKMEDPSVVVPNGYSGFNPDDLLHQYSSTNYVPNNFGGDMFYNPSGADFGEWFPYVPDEHRPHPGDIVSIISDNQISRVTHGDFDTANEDDEDAQARKPILYAVCTTRKGIVCNLPSDKLEWDFGSVVAFIGQTHIRVRVDDSVGSPGADESRSASPKRVGVKAGDVIVPSGFNDGTGKIGRRSDPSTSRYVVGVALESCDEVMTLRESYKRFPNAKVNEDDSDSDSDEDNLDYDAKVVMVNCFCFPVHRTFAEPLSPFISSSLKSTPNEEVRKLVESMMGSYEEKCSTSQAEKIKLVVEQTVDRLQQQSTLPLLRQISLLENHMREQEKQMQGMKLALRLMAPKLFSSRIPNTVEQPTFMKSPNVNSRRRQSVQGARALGIPKLQQESLAKSSSDSKMLENTRKAVSSSNLQVPSPVNM